MANQVAWIGQDGNLWWRQGDNVINAGSASNYEFTSGGLRALNFDTPLGQGAGFAPGVDQIDDPMVQKQVSGSGGSGRTTPVLNQAAVDNTRKAIDSLSQEQQVGYQNIEDNFSSVMGRYDREKRNNRADFDEGIVTNNQNLEQNRQNALVSAAQGLRGLRGVLASIGALSGDGGALANRAVTIEANQDLGGATETAAANAKNLTRAWDRFEDEDEQRRADARTARMNSRTALEGSIARKRQSLLQKLAELFGAAGNTDEATRYLNEAGDLNNVIAAKSRVQSAPIVAKGAEFVPGELDSYLAGAGDMTVDVRRGGVGAGGPTAVLAGRSSDDERRRRRRRPEFATA